MLDFEKSSKKELKDIYPETNISRCYFHYVKILWTKTKKDGLTKKKILFYAYILIFDFKMFYL